MSSVQTTIEWGPQEPSSSSSKHLVQIPDTKWGTSWVGFLKFSRRWRRLADRQPWLPPPRRARPSSSSRLCPLLLQLHPHPCNQLLGKLAAATVVQLQEQGGGKGLLTTRGPPWQRQHLSPHPRPLLVQEKPVHHISNTIPSCDILPTSFAFWFQGSFNI